MVDIPGHSIEVMLSYRTFFCKKVILWPPERLRLRLADATARSRRDLTERKLVDASAPSDRHTEFLVEVIPRPGEPDVRHARDTIDFGAAPNVIHDNG